MIGMTAQLCEQLLQRLDYYDHDNCDTGDASRQNKINPFDGIVI